MPTASIAARSGIMGLNEGSAASSTDGLAELTNIRLRVVHDQLDATSNDSSGWQEFIRGNRGWTATCESLYIPSSAASARAFASAVLNDAVMGVRFMPSTAASATHNYSGNAHVTDFEIGGGTNGLFLNSVSLQGTGALTYSTST